jgi:hypothetical protein
MRRIVLSLLAGLAVVVSVQAQFPVRNAGVNMGPGYVAEMPAEETTPYVGPLWTADVQYLLWFFKPLHFRTPVIGTSADPNLNLGGPVTALGAGELGFVNVLGPGDRNRGPFSGVALTLTRALPTDFTRVAYGELGLLWLPHQSKRYRVASTPDGNPAILLPFANPTATPGIGDTGEYSGVVSGLAGTNRIAGAAEGYIATQMWGGEANMAGPLYRSGTFALEGLFGLRYLGINDLFELTATSSTGARSFDRFSTVNHFVGGQGGLRMIWSTDRFAGMLGTKLALGNTSANLQVRGDASPAATGLPGGFYTGSSNIANTGTDRFATVLDTNLSARFAITQTMGVSVGYNFLYWSALLRATNQVSRTINPTYNAVLDPLTPAPSNSGPALPARINDIEDFWAHGVNFGLDIRF